MNYLLDNDHYIVKFCNENWPSSKAIFALSPEHEQYRKKENGYIVVLDSQFSSITTCQYEIEYAIYVFIFLPYNDIENVLSNLKFEKSGIVLKILTEGSYFVIDDQHTVEDIRMRALYLFEKQTYLLSGKNHESFRKLKRIRNGFELDLKKHEKFFLVNDLIEAISDAELLRNSKWELNGHSKANFLLKNSSAFVAELMALTSKIFKDLDSSNYFELKDYLTYYLASYQTAGKAKRNRPQPYYPIELKGNDISLEEFILKILPEIRSVEALNNNFQYFYMSQGAYYNIYRGKITLVFDLKENVTRNQIFYSLSKVVNKLKKKDVLLSPLPDDYLTDQMLNKGFFSGFKPIAKTICKVVERNVMKNKSYDQERIFFIGIITISRLIKKLNLSVDDMVKLNFFLSIKYMMKPKEQEGVENSRMMGLIRQRKYQIYNQYFKDNNEALHALVNQGLRYEPALEKSKEYEEIILALESYIDRYNGSYEGLLETNPITSSIIRNNFNVQEYLKGILFVVLFEQIITLLNFENQQASLTSYVISEVIMHMKTINPN